LKKAEIPHQKANAGFFAWLDLRKWLKGDDQASEMQLYQHIFENAKVNISPGLVFRSSVPGFFRLCYARPEQMILTSVSKIAEVLASLEEEE